MFFLPPPLFVPCLSDGNEKEFMTLRDLCGLAGVSCRASGPWVERRIRPFEAETVTIRAEPGDWGRVEVGLPELTVVLRARGALLVLAYGLHDLVARQSVQGADWARLRPPRGRAKSGRALSNNERQRRFRQKHSKTV